MLFSPSENGRTWPRPAGDDWPGLEKNFTPLQLIFEPQAAGLWEFKNIKSYKNLLIWLNTSYIILIDLNYKYNI